MTTPTTCTAYHLRRPISATYAATPRDAVIAAYAQERGDFNTLDYRQYDSLVEETDEHVFCGDWGAAKATVH